MTVYHTCSPFSLIRVNDLNIQSTNQSANCAMRVNYSRAIAHLKQADPVLGQCIDRVGTCRLDQAQRSGDLLGTLAESIIHQQLSTKAATTIHQRFLELYPQELTALALQATDEIALRSVGLSRPKIRYLYHLAEWALSEQTTIADLEALDDETIIQELTQIKGIGRWTVQMLLIFRLHRWDVLPVDDLGVKTGIRRVYQLDTVPSSSDIVGLGQQWAPYRSIATWYLWRSLDL